MPWLLKLLILLSALPGEAASAFSRTTTARKDSTGATLSSNTLRYDAHGRIHSTVDPRGGITAYTYCDDDSVSTVTSPDPDGAGPLAAQVTSTTYTVRGRTDVVTLPDGRTSDSDYYLTGAVFQVTGTAAPAVAYTYDYAGRALTLTTQPGTGAAAVTAWIYHSTNTDASGCAPAGSIVAAGSDGPLITCGTGTLRVHQLQAEGRKRMDTAAFLAGLPMQAGENLGAKAAEIDH